MSKKKNILLWVFQILAAVAFLGAGFAKLSGQPMMVAIFDKIGFGQWLRYLTGTIEVAGAILLFLPKWNPIGALLLAATMVGAVLTHVLIIGGSPVPPIVLFVLVAAVAWGRRTHLQQIFNRTRSTTQTA